MGHQAPLIDKHQKTPQPEHREVAINRPQFLFAVASLKRGSGGIAELSRQVMVALLECHAAGQIELHVRVLEDARPDLDDDLMQSPNFSSIHWYQGNRLSFAWSLIKANADLMLMDHVGLARLPGLLPRWLRPRYMLLIHGVEIWNQNRRDYHRSARNAVLLIANSDFTARKSRAHYQDLPPIVVCLPGKDFSSGQMPAAEVSVAIGPRAMLIVGRMDASQRHKGHDPLLQCMPGVLQRVPDAQLIIAGSGDDRKRLEQLARDLDIANQVTFTGWCNDAQLKSLYSRCALFVMPSSGDGFGLVFLEAMQHSLPCVGLEHSAAAEIFQNDCSGVLIDRDDLQLMAEKLSALLLDVQQRKKLGDAAHARYQSQFCTKHYVARFRSILNSSINNLHATG